MQIAAHVFISGADGSGIASLPVPPSQAQAAPLLGFSLSTPLSVELVDTSLPGTPGSNVTVGEELQWVVSFDVPAASAPGQLVIEAVYVCTHARTHVFFGGALFVSFFSSKEPLLHSLQPPPVEDGALVSLFTDRKKKYRRGKGEGKKGAC